MPIPLRIFISSPSDVADERLRADLVIDKLAQDYSRFFAIRSYRWEHEPMLASGHFQDVVEPPSTFDIVVVILWSRLGTQLPLNTDTRSYEGIDGRKPVTGTEWEYEEALRAARAHGAPDILAFRNVSPAPIDTGDLEARTRSIAQLEALDRFWTRHFADRGLFKAAFGEYRTIEQFATRLYESLVKLIERRIREDSSLYGSPVWMGPPFRGLTAYEFDHAAIFFGRDGTVAKAVEQLAANARARSAFLLVSGASGSGKSSLVKGALVPRLMKPQRITGAAFLRRVAFRPSDGASDIIASFAATLVRDGGEGVGLPELLAPGQDAGQLAAHLRGVADNPAYAFTGAIGRVTEAGRKSGRILAYEEAKLIVVIDQLEELFTIPTIAAQDRQLFVRLLAGLARSGAVWVIATVRSDFWHRVAEIPELLALAEGAGRLDVAMPSPAEISEMISKPALAAGLTFEVHRDTGLGLDAVLAEHASNAPGVLPLLSFTLDELYRRDIVAANGRTLTFATYEALGSLEGAIAHRADEIVANLPPLVQQALPRVLRMLTTVSAGSDTVAVARSVPVANFPEGQPARALVDALTDARLLVAATEGNVPSVRLAHEALISRWQRARDQLLSDRRDLETRELIEQQQVRWEQARGQAQRQLLLRDPDLANAIDLERRWRDELQPSIRAFIQASRARARLRQQVAAAAAAVFGLVALGAGYTAYLAYESQKLATERGILAEKKSEEAQEQTKKAEAAQVAAEQAGDQARRNAEMAVANERKSVAEARRAQRSESATLAEESLRETGRGNPLEGMKIALEALPADLQRPGRPYAVRAELALARAMLANRMLMTLVPDDEKTNAAAFSPDEKTIAVGTRGGRVALFDSATGEKLKTFDERRSAVFAVAFSGDSNLVAMSHQDPQSIVVRDVKTGAKVWDQRVAGLIDQLLITPDDSRLIAIGRTGEIKPRILDLKTGRTLSVLEYRSSSSLSGVRWAVLSRSGKHLAMGSYNSFGPGQSFSLWRVDDGKVVFSDDSEAQAADAQAYIDFTKFEEESENISWGGFAGDGETLVLRGKRNIYALNPEDRTVERRFSYAKEWRVLSDASDISPDGSVIALTTASTEVSLFKLADGAPAGTLVGQGSPISRLQYSPNGKLIAATAGDFSIRLWDAEKLRETAALLGHKEFIPKLAFAARSDLLLSYNDRVPRLWDVAPDHRRWSAPLPGPGWKVASVNPEGALAVVEYKPAGKDDDGADETKAVGLWSVRTKSMLRRFDVHSSSRTEVPANAFSPDGGRLVFRHRFYGSDDRPPPVKAEVDRLTTLANRHTSAAAAIPLEETDFYEIVDTATGVTERVVLRHDGDKHSGETVTWSLDGSLLALANYESSSDDKNNKSFVEVWTITGSRPLIQVSQAGSDPKLFFAPDRRALVVSTRGDNYSTRNVVGWRLPDGRKLFEIKGNYEDDTVRPLARDRLLLGGRSQTPSLRETSSGRTIGAVGGQQFGASRVIVRDDERRLLILRDGAPASLWELPDHKLLATLPDANAASVAGQFSTDGKRLATRAWKYEVGYTFDVFDADSGRRIKPIATFKDASNFYLGSTGRYLAVQTASREVEIHDVDGARPPRQIKLQGTLHRWRLAANDRRFVTTDQSGLLQIWDPATGEAIGTLTGVDRQEPIGGAPDGSERLPIVKADASAVVLDVMSGATVWTADRRRDVERIGLSPDSQVAVLARGDRAELIELPGGRLIVSAPYNGGSFASADFSSTGAQAFIHVKGGPSLLYDLARRAAIGTYEGVDFVGVPETGPVLAMAQGSEITIRDIATGALKHRIDLSEDVQRFQLAKSGEALAVSSNKSVVSAIDTESGTVRKVASLDRWPSWIHTVGRSEMLIYENDNLLTLRKVENGAFVTQFATKWPDQISGWGVHVDPTGTYVATRTPDQFVRVYRIADGSVASYFIWGDRRIQELVFSPNGKMLLAPTAKGELVFWDVEAGKSTKLVRLPGEYTDYPKGRMALSAAGSQLLAIDDKGAVSLVSLATHDVWTLSPSQPEPQLQAAMSPDGTLLATYSEAGGLRVWHVGLAEPLLESPLGWKERRSWGVELRFSPDSRNLIVDGQYEEPAIFRMPEMRDVLIEQARVLIARLDAGTLKDAQTETTRLRLGVVSSTIPADKVQALHLPNAEGALVTEVFPRSAALQAGILVGDVILAINDRPIKASGDLAAAVNAADASKDVVISIVRQGRPQRLFTTFAE